MSQTEGREKLRKDVGQLIRSLLISSKGGIPLEKIQRDYREIIGKPIPYRDLGYVSLEEFLDQSPDVCRVSYSSSGLVLHGVATASDAHVASLVSRQVSKRKAKPAKPPARRPNMRQWQPPAPSQPINRVNRFQPNGRSSTNRPGGSGRFPVMQNRSAQSMAPYQQQRLRTPNYQNSNSAGSSHLSNGNGSMMISNNRRQANANSAQQQPTKQQQQNNRDKQQSLMNKSRESNNSNNSNSSAPKNQVNSREILEQYFSQQSLGEPNFKTATMEMKAGGGNQKSNKGKKITKYVSTVKVGEQSFQTFPNSYNSKEQAEDAAAALAIAKLNLSATNVNQNQVEQSQENAKMMASNNNTSNVMSMPIGHFEDMATNGHGSAKPPVIGNIEPHIDKISALLGNRSNGVWSTQIDVEYKRKYQKLLPGKWPTLIEASKEASKKLRVDNPIEGRYIIYPVLQSPEASTDISEPNSAARVKSQDSARHQSAPVSSPSSQRRPPKLQVPEDPNWDVYITCVHSTINVCLRILGDAYSTKFDDMVTNMELKYLETDQVPLDKNLIVSNAEVGKFYAAKVDGDWHRVEVTSVHGLEVRCYFIDHGDEDALKVTDLVQLSPEFLSLPAQAKSVRLAGLEDLASDQYVQSALTNAALGKSLIGQVHAMDESGISMILYDTSNSDEDVNINEKILETFKSSDSNSSAATAAATTANRNGNVSISSMPSLEAAPPATKKDSEESSSSEEVATTSKPSDEKSEALTQDLMSLDLASLKPLMPANMPEVGDFLDVNVTLAASPSNFTVQPWQNVTQLDSFQAELNAFYHDRKNAYKATLTNADIAKGDKFYAGLHMDGKWYRVKVNATIDETTVAAKIVDFGDFTMIPLENLQPLWPQFRNLPMQAMGASLADIVAANGDWCTEDTVWFSERVVNSQFVAKIRDVTYDPLDDNVRISVSLIDTSHPTTDIYIEKQLVEEKRAVYLCV